MSNGQADKLRVIVASRDQEAINVLQAALAERQERMAMLAYEQGEIELIELIRLRGMALAAKRRQLHLAVEEKRQIAFYNQAVGELP